MDGGMKTIKRVAALLSFRGGDTWQLSSQLPCLHYQDDFEICARANRDRQTRAQEQEKAADTV